MDNSSHIVGIGSLHRIFSEEIMFHKRHSIILNGLWVFLAPSLASAFNLRYVYSFPDRDSRLDILHHNLQLRELA